MDQLYQFLSTYQLTRDVGATYEYSNLGAGLLGHILALRAGMDYESLVKTRITGPLGMTSTAITLTPALQARLAPGHDRTLQPTKNWDLTSLAGAGALRSSANDMLTFLAAEMGYTQSPLAPAMKAMLQPRRPARVRRDWRLGSRGISSRRTARRSCGTTVGLVVIAPTWASIRRPAQASLC